MIGFISHVLSRYCWYQCILCFELRLEWCTILRTSNKNTQKDQYKNKNTVFFFSTLNYSITINRMFLLLFFYFFLWKKQHEQQHQNFHMSTSVERVDILYTTFLSVFFSSFISRYWENIMHQNYRRRKENCLALGEIRIPMDFFARYAINFRRVSKVNVSICSVFCNIKTALLQLNLHLRPNILSQKSI